MTATSSGASGFRRIEERQVHQGHVWRVVVAQFEDPSGAGFQRDIVRSPGAVGVVPLVFDAEGNPSVVLVRQYRPPHEQSIIEIPAGMRDVPGEPPATTAGRELTEEVGLLAGAIEHLVDIYPSPGLTDAVTNIFLATDCTATERETHGPEEEHSEVLHVPLREAMAMIDRGEINDAKTVTGLLLVERRLRDGDAGPTGDAGDGR